MDPRLLRHYNQELQHLREMGGEFAQQFPKIAARLRMDGLEVGDPYVERLLEGFAFLAARIQLKLEGEFPQFTQRLLEIVYPNFLAPTPAMLVAHLQPTPGEAALVGGVTLPRGSMLRGPAHPSTGTACRYRTGQDVTLWPLEITDASYFTHATQLPLAAVPEWRQYAGGLRLRLRAGPGTDLSQLSLQDLRLYCTGIDDTAYRLHELLCGHCLGGFVLPVQRGSDGRHAVLDADCVQRVGFDPDQAMLPASLPGLDGYRLLQEYFAFPHRFLFADVCGLGPALRSLGGQELDVVLLFSRGEAGLQQTVDASCLALHCVPAINLFERRCDRIHVTPQTHDFHVVVDRARPMDFEIHQLLEVSGHGIGEHTERRFLPFYAAHHTEDASHNAYYALQREPRLMSQQQLRDGPRASYIGTEVFLSIVDGREAPYPDALQQLSVRALCSNRDLPLLGQNAGTELALEDTAPVQSVRVLKGPSRPLSGLREGKVAWRFISQLSLNHLSLLDSSPEEGAAALRELLRLHVHEADSAQHKQIEGLRSVHTAAVVRRLSMPGPIAFGRGVRIDLEVDELAFQGGSAFLLGCVLEAFLARHVSMNGFTETHVHSPTRGHILVGQPWRGQRPVL